MKKQFKEFKNYTEEEIKDLPKAKVLLQERQFKNGSKSWGYSAVLESNSMFPHKLNERLHENDFNHIRRSYNVFNDIIRLEVPYRFVTGIGKNEKPYHQVQLMFTRQFTKDETTGKELFTGFIDGVFLNYRDLQELKSCGVELNFLERPQSVTDEVVESSFEKKEKEKE